MRPKIFCLWGSDLPWVSKNCQSHLLPLFSILDVYLFIKPFLNAPAPVPETALVPGYTVMIKTHKDCSYPHEDNILVGKKKKQVEVNN